MNFFRIVTIIFLLITIQSCDKYRSSKNSNSLNTIIDAYQNHKAYDSKKYPLGLVTKEYYKKEADFANELLTNLSSIDTLYLSLIHI